MGLELSAESWQVLVAFGCYLVGVMALGFISHRFLTRGSFVKEYFLGNRGLGAWVLALTVAATAISGGTFMGFPSLIYSNGWVMALWIASYMVVPLTTMALMGKRINQMARLGGSVTVPDVLRDRFESPSLGILSTCLILFFLIFNLVAQFKAGGLVMKEALRLPLARGEFIDARRDGNNLVLQFRLADGREDTQKSPFPEERAIYLPERTQVNSAEREVAVYFQMPGKIEPTIKNIRFPSEKLALFGKAAPIDKGYLLGLIVFAITVVAYTTYGGFWAVTWTDVLEGVVMLVGVLIMAFLALRAVPAIEVNRPGPDGSASPQELHGLEAATERLRREDPSLIQGPGPKNYLPLGGAFSFFLMWSLMAAGQPSGMVRLMSFKDSPSLRRALFLVGGYYFLTYVSLIVIFVCARAIFPTQYLREIGSEGEPDSIMPAMTRHVAHPLVAGLLLAAPYAAIMSTVAAFLLMISSSLVRDLYQRTINPEVSPRVMRFSSYLVTALVGVVVLIGALNPPDFLQQIIVFTGSGQGCAFLMPMLLALYWRRATRQGILAGVLGGFVVLFTLYAVSWINTGQFAPLKLKDLDPLVWGLLGSGLLSVGVSLMTKPNKDLVKKYFPAQG